MKLKWIFAVLIMIVIGAGAGVMYFNSGDTEKDRPTEVSDKLSVINKDTQTENGYTYVTVVLENNTNSPIQLKDSTVEFDFRGSDTPLQVEEDSEITIEKDIGTTTIKSEPIYISTKVEYVNIREANLYIQTKNNVEFIPIFIE